MPMRRSPAGDAGSRRSCSTASLLASIIAVTVLAAGVSPEELNDTIRDGERLLVLLLFVVPEAIYDTALIGSRNQTFGKMALGIKVVDADDRVADRLRARVHALALDGVPLGAASPCQACSTTSGRSATTAASRRFHDKFARSVRGARA